MKQEIIDINNVTRFNPSIKEGLTNEQVNQRKTEKLTNTSKVIAGKTYWEILRTDVLSFFNILLFIIAGFMIYANVNDGNDKTKWYSGLFFVAILLSNIILGLYQDSKAKRLMHKLKVMTSTMARVIRDGREVNIIPSEIVLDDIIYLKAGEQVPSDAILLEGKVFVDESMLTGESAKVYKEETGLLYSGSYIVSGSCYARVDHVGGSNYIETITSKAKKFKRNPSKILKSLKRLFHILGYIVIGVFLLVMVAYWATGKLSTVNSFVQLVRSISGQLVAMIPSGLYLLTTFTLASGVIALYRKRANVQDFYSIEMLARSNILCVDKTGTITDGKLQVKEVVSLSTESIAELKNIAANIVKATKDDNLTAQAITKYFQITEEMNSSCVLPFNSDNKYSGASFKEGTYLIGALEYMNVGNKDFFKAKSEEYTSKGYRLLTIAKGNKPINGEKYIDELTPIGFIVLQDHIKEGTKETFGWFKENNVSIRVISGDNAQTVSEIAKVAGIEHADRYISLENMSIEEVKRIACDYVVFGRVSPEQKEALVIALKEKDNTVAMVGDGVNDILALKRADCSIAMNSGSVSTKNVSHVVLLDNNFETMPNVVAEGRRVINNVSRTGTLFLTKTLFAILMSVVFYIAYFASNGIYAYPFTTGNLMIWECISIGISAFFVSLEPDSSPISKEFLRSILKKAAPISLTISLSVFFCYLLFILHSRGVLDTGVTTFGFDINNTGEPRSGATGLAVLTFSIISVVGLYLVCLPLNLYRFVIVASSIVATAVILLVTNYCYPVNNFFDINFASFTQKNWLTIVIMILIIIAIIVVLDLINTHIKEKKEKEHEN